MGNYHQKSVRVNYHYFVVTENRYFPSSRHRWELPVLRYHKIMAIYPYPFLVVITQLIYWIIFINDCIFILTVSPRLYIFMIVYVIQKIRGNENSPDSLNVMVNYHYHGENRLITRYLPSMPPRTHPTCMIILPCCPCSARRGMTFQVLPCYPPSGLH